MEGFSGSVIWVDAALLVVNKPAGLLTLPDGYDRSLPHIRAVLEPAYGRLWIVHRLDRQTSGVLILARSAEVHRNLNRQFEQHAVEKIYHAILHGEPDWDSTVIDLPLRAGVGRRKRTAVDFQRGKPAVSRVQVLQRAPHYSLVEAHPLTGRTHQIRAHLAAIGYPIAGDDLYTPQGFEVGFRFERYLLHARSLRLFHPLTGEPFYVEAPYPEDFRLALKEVNLQVEEDRLH